MAVLEVGLLGPLELRTAQGPVAISGTRQRSLLAVLALQAGRVVPVSAIVEAMWGDPAPDRAEHTLQQHVSAVRKLLGDDASVLETRRPGYVLHATAVDIELFDRAAAAGRAAADRGDPAAAIESFDAALACWRGPALADAGDSLRLAAAATGLEQRHLAVLEARGDALLAAGREAEVVAEVERLVHDHPHREPLWAQLMVALYRCGRQADALAAYGRARAALVEDLGIEPGSELRRLEQDILEQRPSLDRAPATPTTSGPTDDDLFATFSAGSRPDLGRVRLPDGQVVVLPEGETLVGREPAALVRLVDSRVSRRHARIDADATGCTLTDLGSSNGTFVGGERVTSHRLGHGDVISLGGVEVTFLGPPT